MTETKKDFIIENDDIEEYPNNELLVNVCKTFEEQEIILTATFMGKIIQIYNCNAVGNIFENICYPIIKEKLDDFEEGPKQKSPDYYGKDKNFEFEQKVFIKYLIFEYSIIGEKIKIIKFHYLNVYNLVGYSGKTPITMQIKKKVWYNIRPDSVKKWYSSDKTPQLFIDKIIECINECPHIEDKINKINSITTQFNNLKLKYKINSITTQFNNLKLK